MTTHDDLYRKVKAIADLLDGERLSEEADRFRTTITEGVSGTATFMALRFHMGPPTETRGVSTHALDRIWTVVDVIDDALDRAGKRGSWPN